MINKLIETVKHEEVRTVLFGLTPKEFFWALIIVCITLVLMSENLRRD